jgi:hypothetical protein
VGASIAFEAALNRYARQDYILLTYHIHIPLPDPMTNPSTLARQSHYAVRSTPSYFIDGERDGGGGSEDMAKSIFDRKVETAMTKRLDVPAEAKIDLQASGTASTVKVKAKVSGVKAKSDKLRLQIALVEESVTYSGENGTRFHEMVVRSLAGTPPFAARKEQPKEGAQPDDKTELAAAGAAQGFALKPGGGTFECTFDLAQVVADAKAHLEDYETNTRKGEYSFREKKDEVDPSRLAVVAFVEDQANNKVLQAVYVKPNAARTITN